jgi:hypothetical protein
MASMVGGFMEQVADSLVKQGLDSFNKAIISAKEDVADQTSPTTEAVPKQSLIGMIFKSVWEVMVKRIGNLFK